MRLLFVLISLVFVKVANAHEYHVSIINIEYNKDSSSLEVAIKMITNDINSLLKDENGKTIGLGNEDELYNADSILGIYLLNNFRIQKDTMNYLKSYLGHENEEEFTWAFIELKNVKEPSFFKVYCSILLNVGMNDHGHSHQSNLVNIKANGVIKSLYLNANRQSALVVLKE